MSNVTRLANLAGRQIGSMFPGFFPGMNVKHDHYKDFGFPDRLDFAQLYRMYERNGIAAAGIDKTALKTWQDMPFLLEQERDGSQKKGQTKETPLEREIRRKFAALRLWAKLGTVDRMSMVGGYAGLILRIKDDKTFDQPVDTAAGLDALYRVEPVWAAQLTVAKYDTDPLSETYGEPLMYAFSEAAVEGSNQAKRQFNIHPDRVLIWSEDGTVNGKSILEPGFNDLITLEKISGAGGEGFWKNAKSAPVLEVDKEAQIETMARAMGVEVSDLADKMNDQVEDFQKGFDKLLMLQGMTAKTLSITLPSPEHFYGVALQSFAASIGMPVKILVGMQTGERASSEDADEWGQTCMSRRANIVHPNIMELVTRLQRFGILPVKDWFIDQADLTESSMSEKIERANKMADTNQKMGTSTYVFTDDEIRAVVGLEPLSNAEKFRDDATDEETDGAVTPPVKAPAEEE